MTVTGALPHVGGHEAVRREGPRVDLRRADDRLDREDADEEDVDAATPDDLVPGERDAGAQHEEERERHGAQNLRRVGGDPMPGKREGEQSGPMLDCKTPARMTVRDPSHRNAARWIASAGYDLPLLSLAPLLGVAACLVAAG